MPTILFYLQEGSLDVAWLDAAAALAPGYTVTMTQDEAVLAEILPDVEIMAGWSTPALIARAPGVRWVHQWSAGAEWVLAHPQVASRDFVLTNTAGIHAVPITEHVLAMMLAFARGLHHAVRAQSRRAWSYPEKRTPFELFGKTLLLVGVGGIGAHLATVATALGMHVIGVRRNPALGAPGVALMAGPDQLQTLLPAADFVVVTLPLTTETGALFGERELQAMRPGAYLINIGRGAVIQEAALVEALRAGRLAGAGLDVFEIEPLPEDSPLWALENVIITGHYAGHSPRYHERAFETFMDNLRRYRAGEPLGNVVDKVLGY
ncbi:MAG: D-2-hydroxyacid dehydrogenase [Anaerolineae bacterium]|nr:D-2-hydroxyacid dehydrogenase [Anaerolineae bacterium]